MLTKKPKKTVMLQVPDKVLDALKARVNRSMAGSSVGTKERSLAQYVTDWIGDVEQNNHPELGGYDDDEA